MTLYEFNALSDQEQMQCWMQQSRFLMTRHIEEFAVVNLYAIDCFFVEVWFNPRRNQIDGLRSFSSVQALDGYLDQIVVIW